MGLRQLLFRAARLEPLTITMTGVRMGERLLQIGIDDGATSALLAKKIGLSGANALAAADEAEARRARAAADAAGVFIDVQVSGYNALPFAAESFDIVIVHAARGRLASLSPERRVFSLQEARRVLRRGGRIVVIEAAPRGGLAALLRPQQVDEHYARSGGAEGALRAEGFKPVRLLGEVEGRRFTEGLNT
jgi:ubiquinone/menaquinone biosynthesis C-methylase UbiE